MPDIHTAPYESSSSDGGVAARVRIEDLSPREREILALAAKGLTDKEIGLRLRVSLTTVRTYWERLRQKTRTTNRASAVAMFARGTTNYPEPAPTESSLLVTAMESVFGGIVVLDQEERIAAVSDAFCVFVNMDKCSLEGSPISALIERRCEAFYDAVETAKTGIAQRRTVAAFVRTRSSRDVLSSVTVQSLLTDKGPYVTLFVQDMIAELDARRRGMRSGPVLTYANLR